MAYHALGAMLEPRILPYGTVVSHSRMTMYRYDVLQLFLDSDQRLPLSNRHCNVLESALLATHKVSRDPKTTRLISRPLNMTT